MKEPSRREFLKASAVASCMLCGLSEKPAHAFRETQISEDRDGMLIDTTLCIGCRHCEWACKTSHDIPTDELDTYSDRSVFLKPRRPDEKNLTVVNEYKNPNGTEQPTNVKVQCMHCDHPACVSACIVGALSKQENGSVVWDTDKCIGCRYCMIACPFQIPAFEYNTALQPDIVKCDFCYKRREKGLLPACAEICPMEAILYGPRSELIQVARKRIKRNPNKYIDHIYGEHEVGGTSVLYLAENDFSTVLSFPKLDKKTAPGVSEAIQHGIFAYFIPPVALYAILGGLMWITKNKNKTE